MPSLEQLEEFKSSFKDVANEALIMSKNQLSMEDFELPDTAPPSPFPDGLEGPPDTGMAGPSGINLDLPPQDFSGSGFGVEDDFGFSDLLGTGDILSGSTELPQGDPGSLGDLDNLGGAGISGDLNDMAGPGGEKLPEDLLSGFAEDLETGGLPADDLASPRPASAAPGMGSNAPPEDVPGPAAADFSGFDLPEFPDIDLSQAVDMGSEDRNAPSGPKPSETGDAGFGTLEIPGADTDAGAFGTGSLEAGDVDIPGFGQEETVEPGMGPGAELPGDAGAFGTDAGAFGTDGGFGDTDLNSLDLGDEPAAADAFSTEPGFPDDNLGLSTPEDTGPSEGEGADSFDNFSPTGVDWQSPKGDEPDFSAQEDFGDFSLPGFDDALTGPGSAPRTAGTAASGDSDDIEEIRLSEEEYGRLQDTLSVYPLNLRIACEELIAEQAVAPDLMSALVKLLVRGAPAKETAALAGKLLGRNIPIPKGYIKQTGEELEAEQASFGYIFVHSFLPIFRLFGTIALVVLSLAYLSWRFIITPWQAEKLYTQGYETLQAGEYIRANELFRQGLEKYRMKKWFYRYAEGFRDERQYIYAERKYDELLQAYPRDKKGALDYAALESNYIKNYEKADRIIRTNILDYAVNDREGLIALAENNLAWAETDPSRYEEARAAYARLLDRYGRQDPFLEGMLKYFIRTDKLNEVLPLQAYFMGNPKKR
ncbi:MAG: hypothetical protein LBP60_01350, partial [Spirochaetaceae bacterium]|nr:hypothetical protein [Spirochaetaceae bacterium]